MLRGIVCCLTIVVLAGVGYAVQGATQQQPSTNRAVINQYCLGCHNEKLKTGGLTLENVDLSRVGDQAPLFEKLVQKLRSGSMPPAGYPGLTRQPTAR
jgi:cytochrome c551/c552